MKLSLKQKVWFGSMAVCVFGLVGFCAALSYREGEREKAQIRLSRAEGVPIELSDLNVAQVPDSENAASKIQDAWALSRSRCREPYKLFERAFIVQTQSGVRRLSHGPDTVLEGLQPLIDCLRKAAAEPRLEFGRKWGDTPRVSFGYTDLQTYIRIVIADAERRDRQGDYSSGTAEFIDASRLSNLVSEEPGLLSILEGFTSESMLENELEGTLWQFGPTPWMLDRIASVTHAMGPTPSLRNGLSGELVLHRAAIQSLDKANPRDVFGQNPPLGSLRLSKIAFVRAGYDASLLESWRRLFQMLPSDDSDPAKTASALANWERWLSNQTDWTYDYAHVVSFGFQGVIQLETSELAHRRVLDTLAKLLRQRTEGVRFSGRLSPTIETRDPYGNEPLHALAKPGGFIVYSLGPDRTDQMGRRYETFRFSNARPNISAEYPGLKIKFSAKQLEVAVPHPSEADRRLHGLLFFAAGAHSERK